MAAVVMVLLGALFVLVAVVANPREEVEPSAVTTSTPAAEAPGMAPGTTAPLGDEGLGEGTAPEVVGRTPLAGFGEVQAVIEAPDGETCEVCLLSATSGEQRARGLMEVTDEDLGGYQGMLFEGGSESEGGFWMRNTPLPLSIAYADAEGTVVAVVDMEPCGDDGDCPTYPSPEPFQYALEVPQGQADELGLEVGSTIRITGRSCPLADYGP